MKKVIIPVAFGTLDVETFNRSYRPLFLLFGGENIRPAFLNKEAASLCGVPLLEDVLKNIEQDTLITVFPLILNYGKEYSLVKETCMERKVKILPPLLESMEEDVVRSIKKQCNDEKNNYVLLGHGSRFAPEKLYAEVVSKLPSNVKLVLHHGASDDLPYKITTLPLMLICGRHVQAMNNELSETHEVVTVKEGLLDDPDFRTVLAKKTEALL